MSRSIRLGLAAAVTASLLSLAAAPAGAQVPEVPPLGFEIDRTEGAPGEVVNGQVDVADVEENCTTDLDEFRTEEGDFFQGIVALVEHVYGEPVLDDPTNFEELAAVLIGVIAVGALFDEAIGQQIFEQTFVMTFADIATQDPVGEIGNFDPATGEGSVTVPDIEPGLWAVAATCVVPTSDPAEIEAALGEITPIVEGLDLSGFGFSEPFPTVTEILLAALEGGDFTVLLEEVGPSLLAPLMVPQALGVQLFNVLPDPQDLIADIVADIDGLVADGELKAGQARGLTRPLDNASRSLDGDKVGPACNQLANFVAEANDKVADGALDPAAAADLIAQAEAIQTQLGCT